MGRQPKQRVFEPGSLAESIDRFMRSHGLEQTEWAKASGIGESTLRRVLDTSKAEYETLQKLAAGAGPGVTVQDLAHGTSPKRALEARSAEAVWREQIRDAIIVALGREGVPDPIAVADRIFHLYDDACLRLGYTQPKSVHE
jgi:hypothetical protein